tara:strand:- start:251 stop:670 length:420 start_codon:yes stop_codon:yes gene_type:complete
MLIKTFQRGPVPHPEWEGSFDVGYTLELRQVEGDRTKYTLQGMVRGIGGVGNYDAEKVIRDSDTVNVIPYWKMDDDGRHCLDQDGEWIFNQPDGEGEVVLDSESSEFWAYMDTKSAVLGLIQSLDDYINLHWEDQLGYW